jgi:hypothetical protein
MSPSPVFEFNIQQEVDRLFGESSQQLAQPVAVILMGGIATGKTTLRQQKYGQGYVVIDAGEIFLNLSRGEFFPFPGLLQDAMEIIGCAATKRALSGRHQIVTQIIGADHAQIERLTHALESMGYKVEIALLTCRPEEAAKRNAERDVTKSISAFYSEPFHTAWIVKVAADLHAENSFHRIQP